MMKEAVKIVVYKDGNIFMIPSAIFGYSSLAEVNGKIIEHSNAKYITVDELKTLRIATATEITVSWQYGDKVIPVFDYDSRLEYLQKTYKEKIDEKYDDDGMPLNVCIWKNKEAEKEYYILTNKYHPIRKRMFTFVDVFFEVIALPKSNDPYIIPDWKVSKEITDTCLFKREDYLKAAASIYIAMYPSIKCGEYLGNSSKSIFLNNTSYYFNTVGLLQHGTLKQCRAAKKAIDDEFKRIFRLENGKIQNKSLVNLTTVYENVKAIRYNMSNVSTKAATLNTYRKAMSGIDALIVSLEKEMGA